MTMRRDDGSEVDNPEAFAQEPGMSGGGSLWYNEDGELRADMLDRETRRSVKSKGDPLPSFRDRWH